MHQMNNVIASLNGTFPDKSPFCTLLNSLHLRILFSNVWLFTYIKTYCNNSTEVKSTLFNYINVIYFSANLLMSAQNF